MTIPLETIHIWGSIITAFYLMHFFDLDIIFPEHAIVWVVFSIGASMLWPVVLLFMIFSDIVNMFQKETR